MSWAIITHIDKGVAADRPAAGAVPGRHYGWWSTDTKELSISDGSTWTVIGPGGSGVTYGTPAVALGTAAANGSTDEAIRRDATIVAFDATNPTTQAFGDSAATGSAAVAARRDHKHAMPANPFAGATAGGALDGTYPNPGLAAGVAGAGLAESSDVLSVNVDGSTIEIATDTLQVKDSGITSAKIANGAIVDADVNASAAIAYSKLNLASSIVTGDIVDGTIVVADLSAAAIAALSGFSTPWSVVVKALDESVQSSTAMQADDELLFTAASGGLYDWEAFIVYVSPVGAGTPDILIGFAEDATGRGNHWNLGYTTGDGPGLNTTSNVSNNGSSKGTAATNRVLILRGFHLGNGGTAAVYWAQNSSSSNATTVKAGSVLRYRRIL